jgi:hypothetical protein
MRISSTLFAVDVDGRALVLDLRRDRYWSLRPGVDIAELRGPVVGEDAPSTGAPCFVEVMAACLWAGTQIRRKRLDRTLYRLRAEAPCLQAADLDKIVEAFELARPWHPAPRRCLIDSLALLKLSVVRGCEADIVFAVRAMPFAAHCWLEQSHRIINDDPDYCAAFTEIARL